MAKVLITGSADGLGKMAAQLLVAQGHDVILHARSPQRLIAKPKRLVYLSSGLHRGGDASLQDLLWERRAWNGFNAYSDSKPHDVILAFAVARKWKEVYSNRRAITSTTNISAISTPPPATRKSRKNSSPNAPAFPASLSNKQMRHKMT